jgi:2'-5' RNA ligase
MAARGPAPGQLRLFVALWPDESLQQQLLAQSAPLAELGRRIPARNLHVTLAFLGGVEEEKAETVIHAMREARPPACDFTLDRLGYFAQSRIVWAGAGEVPAELAAYQARLNEALARAGLRSEKRAFKLHVSLLREVEKAPAAQLLQTRMRLPWAVREVALVASELASGGSRYRVLARVPAAV